MDLRIYRTPMHDKLKAVDRSKKVHPANQDEPEQDAQKFSDQLKFARKDDEKKGKQDQKEEEKKKQKNTHSRDEHSSPKNMSVKLKKDKVREKLPPDSGKDDQERGSNIDIKV